MQTAASPTHDRDLITAEPIEAPSGGSDLRPGRPIETNAGDVDASAPGPQTGDPQAPPNDG